MSLVPPAHQMLVVRPQGSSQKTALEHLLAGLPGLVIAPDLAPGDLDNAEVIHSLQQRHGLNTTFVLCFERDQLFLCKSDVRGRYSRQRVALESAALGRRTGSPSELQRACFGSSGRTTQAASLRVLDLFAGWGMDGFSLAASGALVTCVEWQPAMVALVRDAARRVPSELAARLKVIHGEARQTLEQVSVADFDIVYLDPMFPARKKGALPNKRLQWLAQLNASAADTLSAEILSSENLSTEISLESLIELSAIKAAKHVVLKRRRKDPVTGAPDRQITGSSVRYDIYSAS